MWVRRHPGPALTAAGGEPAWRGWRDGLSGSKLASAGSTILAARPETTQFDVGAYIAGQSHAPIFLCGDALAVLGTFPPGTVDMAMTSPPYWGHRDYSDGGIGQESHWETYVENLLRVTAQVQRVLKPSGSFWLNLGDSYEAKSLLGIPWRVALAMADRQGWILRNSVVWHKVKGGPDNSKDKLRNVHELVFHFVKGREYFFDADAIRTTPSRARVENGAVVSATGVTGVRYQRQIELSGSLTPSEKKHATTSLEAILREMRLGRLADFRMIIRGQQRVTHSDSNRVSGRAKELAEKGFYFLKYHPRGAKPKDVWDILPEDTQGRATHFAPYPEDLCKIPLMATCPEDGLVLDPFCGTGTTNLVAFRLGRKSIGIDLSAQYLEHAKNRCRLLL